MIRKEIEIEIKPNLKLTMRKLGIGEFFCAERTQENTARNYASTLKEIGLVFTVKRTDSGIMVTRVQ